MKDPNVFNSMGEVLSGIPRQKIVFFTGAGISKESGIPTFRDADGLWRTHDPEVLGSISGFFEDTETSLNFLNELRLKIHNSSPNHAHEVIATLEANHDVTVVTQNVDNLHERAGSSNVIHLHGEMSKISSSVHRLDPECLKEYPLHVPIKVGDMAADGSQMRPAIVMFGEYLSDKVCSEAEKAIRNADILVVIGTSLKVHPAASFMHYASKYSMKYIIDPADFEPQAISDFTHIKEPATKGIDTMIAYINEFYEQ